MKVAFRRTPFRPEQKEELSRLILEAGHESLWLPDNTPTADDLKDCEVLMGYFPPDLMRFLPKLKWIQTPAAGVDKLCGEHYANEDIVLTNCSGAFGIAIAEYMLAGLLMLMRGMPAYHAHQRAHRWACAGTCRTIYGSRITVLGTGDIGTSFARRAAALGAHIRGVNRTGRIPDPCFEEIFTSDRIPESVAGADAVVLCLPGTSETARAVNAAVFAAMSSQAIICNTGRGFTVSEPDMIKALQEKRVAGAVLDVFETEPLPADSPLWDMENVIITPHIAGHDDDPINAERIFDIFRENLSRYLTGRELTHVVDRELGY